MFKKAQMCGMKTAGTVQFAQFEMKSNSPVFLKHRFFSFAYLMSKKKLVILVQVHLTPRRKHMKLSAGGN